MLPSEFFSELKARLENIEWPGTSNKIFYRKVWVVPELPQENIAEFGQPSCFILDQGIVNDKEYARLMWQKFSLAIFLENPRQNMGESTMVGGGAIDDSSIGQGCKSIESVVLREVIEIIELGTPAQPIQMRAISLPRPQVVNQNRPDVFKFMSFQAWCHLD